MEMLNAAHAVGRKCTGWTPTGSPAASPGRGNLDRVRPTSPWAPSRVTRPTPRHTLLPVVRARARRALSTIAQEHPEFCLQAGGATCSNLADPKALRYDRPAVHGRRRARCGHLPRKDFNIDPLPFWRAVDTERRPHRRPGSRLYLCGMSFRAAAIVIDNCASGGRRIDLRTVVAQRQHRFTPFSPPQAQSTLFNPYTIRGAMCSGAQLSWTCGHRTWTAIRLGQP